MTFLENGRRYHVNYFVRTFDAMIRNKLQPMLFFDDVHLHVIFSSAHFNWLNLFCNHHFSPTVESFRMTMVECNNCWYVVAMGDPGQYCLHVTTNSYVVMCYG